MGVGDMSRVQVRDMSNGEVGTISREALVRNRTKVEKVLAWIGLVVGWIGSVSTAHGGWGNLIASPSLGLACAGLGTQALLTWAQWSYGDKRSIAWPARVIDATLTALGYGFLFIIPLTVALSRTGLSMTPWPVAWFVVSVAGLVAWAVIWVLALLVAWYPERTLVR